MVVARETGPRSSQSWRGVINNVELQILYGTITFVGKGLSVSCAS